MLIKKNPSYLNHNIKNLPKLQKSGTKNQCNVGNKIIGILMC